MRFSIADFNCNISVLLLHFLPFKVNCSKYEFGYYLDTSSEGCNIKSTLTVDDFDKNYALIKILNKKKL